MQLLRVTITLGSCRDLQPVAPLLHQSVGGFPLACLGFLPGQRERGPVEGTRSVVLAAVCTATLLLWAFGISMGLFVLPAGMC